MKRKRSAAFLAAIVLLAASMAVWFGLPVSAAPAAKGNGKFMVLRGISTEVVRASADPASASLGTLANGKQIELMQTAAIKFNDYTYYFKVVFKNQTGYICTKYLDEVRPNGYFAVQPDYSKYANYVRVKCWGTLNVRTSANTKSKTNILKKQAERGDILALKSTTKQNGCWQVEFDGQTAYVSASESYTERINPTAIPSGNAAAKKAAWTAIVNQKNQTVSVYKNKTLIRFFACTTGSPDEEWLTPVGTFTLKKDMGGVPGKKSLFFSWHTSDREKEIRGEEDLTVFDCVRIKGPVYFHRLPRQANGSYEFYISRLNTPRSHGCIRIPEVHSRWMYDNFAYGGVTVVQPL